MRPNAVDVQRLWRIHALWAAALFAVAWFAQDQRLTAELVTLGVLLICGQAALGIPTLLRRALPWAVVFAILFDSIVVLGQLWGAATAVAPIYVGFALAPAVLVARWQRDRSITFVYWAAMGVVDVVLRLLTDTLVLWPLDSALLTWIGMLPVLALVTVHVEGKEREPPPKPADDSVAARLITVSEHLWVTTGPEQALEVALETIGSTLSDEASSRIMSFAMTFSKVDLDEFVVSALHEADRSWKGRHLPIRGIAKEALMSGDPTLAKADDWLLDQFPALRDRWILLLPLYTRLDAYGVLLFAHRREPQIDSNRLEVFRAIADMTSQMLRVHHLQSELERSRREVLLDEEDTRHQLARDLHDGPVQKVSALSMQLDFIKHMLEKEPENVPDEIDDAQEMVQEATHELRTFMFGLRPVVLETEGLVPALEQFTKRLRTQDSVNVDLDAQPVPRLDSTVEQNVFAIVREAVGNAKKYADGAPVTVSVAMTPMGLRTVVADEGPGFNLEKVERSYGRRASLGLLNMKERAEMIDGFLEIRTAPGEGTEVELLVPTQRRDA